ncbi:ABC-F family ATP-binding cassette domain-containing protein [Streptomyces xanthii]|uniref:ABC-F family ATP-binding cassette domain-containing protein n=1 Tax=Streptomyces xanthii TaxID=2768069 RepID=A0A7H1BH34_9ACTN|nr:ABC-F family ATP-binding cassette domain-containing protein [Streptomyces xanthii]QNS08039.1 ABC-F family ATP-binding cassette domain-containing protein [Streptomyces xanthii]
MTEPTPAPAALIAHDLVRSLGDRRVLDGVSLTAAPGRRIGLIGENGVGKSTLIRLLAGTDRPDSGRVERPAELGCLQQELPYPAEAAVADVLDDALREARHTLAELDRLAARVADAPEDAELLDAYGRLLQEAEEKEVWDADRRAGIVLAGLGLGAIPYTRTVGSLSGGQRSRLALAALLVRRPTALLLDEPTNHLDDAAAAFLEEQLRGLPGAVVVASHDRAFLDAVCTDLLDLDPALDGPVRFGGTYSAYLAEKRAERARWERRYAEEQEALTALRASVDTTARRVAPDRGPRDTEKMGYGLRAGRVQSQIARRVRNAARRLDDLERAQIPAPPRPLVLAAPAVVQETGTGDLVELSGVHVPGRLAVGDLTLSPGDRLLVTGGNGAGKSTLLAVLAGRLTAAGAVRRRPGLTVGLLAQDTEFERPERSAQQVYTAVLGPARAEATPLSALGLLAAPERAKSVAHLSVGQRRRLALALLVARPPELLLLDEPTNHLSPSLCDELEEALRAEGPGAVVVASHDRWLRSRWTGRVLGLAAVHRDVPPPPG